MAELVDAHDSKSCGAIHESSILSPGTIVSLYFKIYSVSAMKDKKIKVVVIVGPTATGKSNLAIKLARTLGGEVISADSRQVYTGLDIGSGKVTPEEMNGVPHHLLDVVSPKRRSVFTAAEYQKLAQEKIKEISSRGNVPIICGGTGFYIQAAIDNIVFPDVPPNKKLRAELAKKSTAELANMLKKLDLGRWKSIDTQNPRRLIRAIEIATELGSVPKLPRRVIGPYDPLFIGLELDSETLQKRIHVRLLSRLESGMIEEVRKLHANGVSWKRLESFGLEYRHIALFLQKKVTHEQMIERLEIEIGQFAKRQMVWFKKDKRIHWFTPHESKKILALTKTQTKKIATQ